MPPRSAGEDDAVSRALAALLERGATRSDPHSENADAVLTEAEAAFATLRGAADFLEGGGVDGLTSVARHGSNVQRARAERLRSALASLQATVSGCSTGPSRTESGE